MAFGFFKRNEAADIIFMGGRIFTQNSNFPEADAVACKDGRILAVGDYEDLTDLEGKHTEVIDLGGKIVLPGYIDTCGHPVMEAFRDSCLFLENNTIEVTLKQISDYAAKNENAEIIFAYDFDESLQGDLDAEQIRAFLDEIETERPIVVLSRSGLHCWINTIALETVKAAAEEDEMNVITLPYLFGVLDPVNLDSVLESVPSLIEQSCNHGFTSVFDCGAPDYFASSYQNMLVHLYQEELLNQRFFGSLLVTGEINPKLVMYKLGQYKTNCTELNEMINFNTLKLLVNTTLDEPSISDASLKELCLEAGDKGYHIHIDAVGDDAVVSAVQALEATRAAGYKKNAFTIAYDPSVNIEELVEAGIRPDITETFHTYEKPAKDDWLCIEYAKSIEEAIDALTIDAAIQLGIDQSFGSIEKGKHADFVVFEENPFEAENMDELKKLEPVMTVIDGKIIYHTC